MNDGRQKSLIMPQQKKNIIYEHYTIVMWSHHFVVAFAARSVSLLLLFDGSKRNFNAALVSITLLVPLSWFRRHVYDRSILSASSWKTCISSYWHNILTQQSQRQKYIITFYFDFWQKCWSIIQMLLMPTMKPNSSDKSEKFVRSFCHFRANCQMGKKVQAQKKAAHTLTSKSISNGWRAAELTAAT